MCDGQKHCFDGSDESHNACHRLKLQRQKRQFVTSEGPTLDTNTIIFSEGSSLLPVTPGS